VLSDQQRAALTARLRQTRRTGDATDEPVVELSVGGGTPVFAPHAVGGSVHEYAALARQLGDACHVYGITASGVRAGQRPGASLEEMATRYARLIRRIQPDGPYRLVGWSMGGVLAYETALRLVSGGARVALVALIDTPARAVSSYADTEEALAALFVADAIGDGRAQPPISGRLPVPDQLDALANHLTGGGSDTAALREELDRRYAVFAAHTAALAGYRPTTALPSDAVLIGCAGSPDSTADWAAMFGGTVTTARTPGDHYSCLRPPWIAGIAQSIRDRL
jgi:thioesterase domain-containing protein